MGAGRLNPKVTPMIAKLLRAGLAGMVLACACATASAQKAETVQFPSLDGTTRLVAYMYKPSTPGPHPAVVLMHGRGGLYSNLKETADADSMSSRHVFWGRFWAEKGYVSLLVDSFGPRGHARGFAAGTNDGRRPQNLNEVTVRPLDAYGALDYLRSRGDVIPGQVFLQGWSNGGSAALSTASVRAPGIDSPTTETGFRAFLAFYPACTQVTQHYTKDYATYAPLALLIGGADEEVNAPNCRILAENARRNGSDLELVWYEGATHSFDTPSKARQSVAANAEATQDSIRRATEFFGRYTR